MGQNDDWTPRHVFNDGETGEDCCDVFAKGITGQAYLDWVKEHLRPGPPVVVAAKPKPKPKPKPKAEAAPVVAAPASNVMPLRQPEPEEDIGLPPEFSEDALAERFSERYADTMKYCAPAQAWYIWADNVWQRDESGLAVDNARRICKIAAADVQLRLDLGAKRDRIGNFISSRRTFANVEAIARSDRRHVVKPTKFDSRIWILNTPGGIVDLRTGQLRPATKDDFCTLSTAVAPDGEANCPKWRSYLLDATNHDRTLEIYLQRIAGYALTGAITEHKFFFCYGGGGNGKGTYVNTIDWLLGTYSKVAPMDTFTETKFSKHSTELAFLQGARLVTAQEVDAGAKWNESRIKTLTGGDPITARHLYQSEFTFYPTFKLLFSGNNRPIIKQVDDAIRRRMYLIPFEYKVPDDKRDGGLQDYLREVEGPGILQWAIDGCLDWQRHTLNAPERVKLATGEYFEEEDRINAFLNECVERGLGLRELTTRLYNRYRDWCDETGEFAVSRKRFLSSIAQKGYRSKNLSGAMQIEGLALPAAYLG